MIFKNADTSSVFLMPKEVEKYIKNANETELRLILYIFANSDFEKDAAADALGISENEIESALSFWRGTGIIKADGAVQKKTAKTEEKVEKQEKTISAYSPRSYTSSEIASVLSKNKDFASLYEFAQKKLERIFNPTETASLYALCDYVLIPYDMLMAIIEYCARLGKKSMRYVEKTALSIYDSGIDTYEKLEEYLLEKTKCNDGQNMVKKIIGAENRALSAAEKTHINRWITEYETPRELIEKAYEKMINTARKPSVQYMSKILESWHTAGIKSISDLENMPKGNFADDEDEPFDLNDFILKPDAE